jgi:hypothetical protein
VPTIAVTQPINALGEWFSIVGLVGVAGGAQTGAVGTSVTAWGALPLSPGAGGAGCTTTDFAGGAQTATAAVDLTSQGWYTNAAGNLAAAGRAAGTIHRQAWSITSGRVRRRGGTCARPAS